VVFARRVSRRTPGRFHTKVIARGVEPAIQVHYRASKVKQYFKQGRALRTETTVNDTYDFGIGRLLTTANWEALLRVGHDINQRLLDAQLEACACAPDATTLERVVLPSTHDGQPAPGLRFGDPRVMALLASLCAFSHLLEGLTNRSLRTLVTGLIPGYTARQMTFDLRRLRRKGLIRRLPGSQRYTLTADGRRLAVFFTNTYTRIVCPSPRGDPPNRARALDVLLHVSAFPRMQERHGLRSRSAGRLVLVRGGRLGRRFRRSRCCEVAGVRPGRVAGLESGTRDARVDR
jgi:hypothetical protein